MLAALNRIDWETWKAQLERYATNTSTGKWNRKNLALWPQVIRSRDDGSLRHTLAAAATELKVELVAYAEKWRTAHQARKKSAGLSQRLG